MVNGTSAQQNLAGVFGIVLAGGQSSRMGSDKARLPFRGGTLLDHQFRKLVSILGIEHVLVSGNYPSFKHTLDREPGLGPLGGIIAAVNELPLAEYFLFLPVDMPNLTEETLLRLIQAANRDPAIPCFTFRNYEMPLLLKNHLMLKTVLTEISLQAQRLRSVRNLCELVKFKEIEIDNVPSEEFLNTNTLKEWKEATNEHTC